MKNQKNAINNLGARLLAAYSLVRRGSAVCDVGSDHGYLPLALLEEGVCKRAVISDVNRAPLESAVSNFSLSPRAAELSEKALFIQADGLPNIDFGGGEWDVCICGMGGELICRIIENAPVLKNKNFHLILQPMTRADRLREFLWSGGFEIEGERHALDAGKLYTVMSVTHSGEKQPFTPIDAKIGKRPKDAFAEGQLIAYFQKILDTETKIYSGKHSAGKASREDEALLRGLAREIEIRKEMLK